MRLAVLAASLFALAVVVAGCGSSSGESALNAPRGVSLSPDGMTMLVVDAGTGKDDGKVVSFPVPAAGKTGDFKPVGTKVVFKDLPSQKMKDEGYATVAGPSAAAMAPDGVVCVVIGDGGEAQPGELRCTDGLKVDLTAVERDRNPDKGPVVSDPFGIAADADGGWFVSDLRANSVLFIDRAGEVTVVAVFKDIEGLPSNGQPAGVYAIQGQRGSPVVGVALYGGALAGFSPALQQPPVVQQMDGRAIALQDDGAETLALLWSDSSGAPGTGSVFNMTLGLTVAGKLDRPSGFVKLPDGRLLVSYERTGKLEIVGKPR